MSEHLDMSRSVISIIYVETKNCSCTCWRWQLHYSLSINI